ncbi:MAG: hypothetical protein ACPGGK_08235 [Pikeienuella sp.]
MTLHLHIGAHKTATTHIQNILRKNRDALAANDVEFLPPEDIRDAIKYWRIAAETMAPLPTVSGALAGRKLARMDKGSARIIASDENSLGHCRTMIRRGALYARASTRLSLWRRLAEKRETTVYLSVRNYAPFFTSAYAQSVRGTRYYDLTADMLKSLARLPRRWTDVAADAQRALPGANLIIWDFADYKALRSEILERLCGFPPPKHVKRRPMATPSMAGMAAYATAAASSPGGVVSREQRLALAAELPITAESPKFNPWPKEMGQFLDQEFAKDKALLREQFGANFLVKPKA